MIKSPPKMAGIVIFVLLFSSEYDIFVLNNNVLGVLTMDKIKANLIKAIEGKTNAWQRLSVKDILDLAEAIKTIWSMGEKVEYTQEGISLTVGSLPDIENDDSIGFCD